MPFIFNSKLLPDMLNFDKYDEDGKELIQKFHDRYNYLNSFFKKTFLKLNFSFEF